MLTDTPPPIQKTLDPLLIWQLKTQHKETTCEVLVVAGLGVSEDTLCVEAAELRELLLPRLPNEFCASFSCCDCVWSLAGNGRLDRTIL